MSRMIVQLPNNNNHQCFFVLLWLKMCIQVRYGNSSMEGCSYWKNFFINGEVRGVQTFNRRWGCFILCPNEKECSCHPLGIEPEVLCSHQSWGMLHVIIAKQDFSNSFTMIIDLGIIYSWRIWSHFLHETDSGRTLMYACLSLDDLLVRSISGVTRWQ